MATTALKKQNSKTDGQQLLEVAVYGLALDIAVGAIAYYLSKKRRIVYFFYLSNACKMKIGTFPNITYLFLLAIFEKDKIRLIYRPNITFAIV